MRPGAATNPDPEVFAYAAAQVKVMLEVTKRLGGANYVLWGGREGYETLLNTDMKRELDQFGRFLALVAEHKHAIGFTGTLLIEPKPQEPTKHQYDYDAASIYAFLQTYGLENEYRTNLEVNHATLAGHTFHHEVVSSYACGIFGSVDINRGDYQNGWDTDQFPNSVEEICLPMHEILKNGGLHDRRFQLRHQAAPPEHVPRRSLPGAYRRHGHAGHGVDGCRRHAREGHPRGATRPALRRLEIRRRCRDHRWGRYSG